MRDLFARFASNPGVTPVTGVTLPRNTPDSQHLCDAAGVTLGMRGEGTTGNMPTGDGAHPEPTPAAAGRGNTPVTLLPTRPAPWVTPAGEENAKQGKGFSQVLPALPTLPAENDATRAHAMLGETFARIAGWWVEGAALPSAALEGAIDRALLSGDLGALQATLAVYEQAARESCARGGR